MCRTRSCSTAGRTDRHRCNAPARSSDNTDVEALKWDRRLNFYYFGSSSPPFVIRGDTVVTRSCGKVFNGVFILSAASTQATRR